MKLLSSLLLLTTFSLSSFAFAEQSATTQNGNCTVYENGKKTGNVSCAFTTSKTEEQVKNVKSNDFKQCGFNSPKYGEVSKNIFKTVIQSKGYQEITNSQEGYVCSESGDGWSIPGTNTTKYNGKTIPTVFRNATNGKITSAKDVKEAFIGVNSDPSAEFLTCVTPTNSKQQLCFPLSTEAYGISTYTGQ